MQRHAAEVKARLFAPRPIQAVVISLEPAPSPEPEVEQESFVPPKAVAPEDFEEPTAFPLARLMTLCSHVTKVLQRDIKSPRRSGVPVKARQIFFWLAKAHTGASLPQIARHVGGRDHTTALHGIRQVQAVIDRQNIKVTGCPVEMAEKLWAANWKGPV
jgi:hypothetical protein